MITLLRTLIFVVLATVALSVPMVGVRLAWKSEGPPSSHEPWPGAASEGPVGNRRRQPPVPAPLPAWTSSPQAWLAPPSAQPPSTGRTTPVM
jgi:hypothetical protein